MPDMIFEESCPCGNDVKISGYSSQVQPQITAWRKTHNPHANMILKTLVGQRTKKVNKDYDLISVDIAEPTFGAQIGKGLVRTHGASDCAGPVGENGKPICCIHNPSNHHMVTWGQNWRGDKGMMERLCLHGIGHPDPDDLAVRTTEWAGVHGCDGCCTQEPKDAQTNDL